MKRKRNEEHRAREEIKVTNEKSLAASEIARSAKHFETWASHHGLHHATHSDLPETFRNDLNAVFDYYGKLPESWTDETSKSYRRLEKMASSRGLGRFFCDAFSSSPTLFSKAITDRSCRSLAKELETVYDAWEKVQSMRKGKEKNSENEVVAMSHHPLRDRGIRKSVYRIKRRLSLPRPLQGIEIDDSAKRVLGTRLISPDSAILIRPDSIRRLSSSKNSPFNCVNTHPSTLQTCGLKPGDSFRYQATPCMELPDERRAMEFISSVWEDKKPNINAFDTAYRQNRMACASAARHLWSFNVQIPVFGLLWADGKVRAHVDWCAQEGELLRVYSAPYPGPQSLESNEDRESTAGLEDFFEWDLSKPADIISVFLLIQNIDDWTAGPFRERIEESVKALSKSISQDTETYIPWRREQAYQDTQQKRKKIRL